MGTRGCVAVGTLEKWSGPYNHMDSYPSGLGKEVWGKLQEARKTEGGVKAFAERLLECDDWRQIETGGVCEYCGKKGGQPHSISGTIYMLQKNLKPGEYPDPEAKHHGHNEGNPAENHISNEEGDPLFIEWVYVIDVGANALHVLASRSNSKSGRSYAHFRIVTLPINDNREPNWKYIGEGRRGDEVDPEEAFLGPAIDRMEEALT